MSDEDLMERHAERLRDELYASSVREMDLARRVFLMEQAIRAALPRIEDPAVRARLQEALASPEEPRG